MFNNNTAEFDRDVAWVIKYYREQEKENVPLGKHRDLFQTLIQLLELIHGPLTSAQVEAINNALHGSLDLKVLRNSSAIMDLLKSQQNNLLLSQLTSINNLDAITNSKENSQNSNRLALNDAQGSTQVQNDGAQGNVDSLFNFTFCFQKLLFPIVCISLSLLLGL